MSTRWIAGVIGAVIAVAGGLCMFTVNVTDYAILGEFGKIGVGRAPGLHSPPEGAL
jgi:hypothetical protein